MIGKMNSAHLWVVRECEIKDRNTLMQTKKSSQNLYTTKMHKTRFSSHHILYRCATSMCDTNVPDWNDNLPNIVITNHF